MVTWYGSKQLLVLQQQEKKKVFKKFLPSFLNLHSVWCLAMDLLGPR